MQPEVGRVPVLYLQMENCFGLPGPAASAAAFAACRAVHDLRWRERPPLVISLAAKNTNSSGDCLRPCHQIAPAVID